MEKIYAVGIERRKDEALLQSFAEYDGQKIMKAESTPQEPFEMEISEGTTLYDVVGYQDTWNFAISKKMYDLLKSNKVTGWEGYRITIKGIEDVYFGFQVTGKCGALFSPKEEGFYTGFRFDHNSWGNSDFFSPDGTMLIFCTEKVRSLFKIHKITNVSLPDISTVESYSFGSQSSSKQ